MEICKYNSLFYGAMMTSQNNHIFAYKFKFQKYRIY